MNPDEAPPLKIQCAMSLPRQSFSDTWGCIINALAPFQIPVFKYQGAWWEQCLQNVLEDFVTRGVDVAVICDYDGLFTPEQFNELLICLMENPHIDAICSMQNKRESNRAMFKPSAENFVEGQAVTIDLTKPLKCDSGHFGLTLIRMDRLKDLPKPWFLNIPGNDGSWRQESPGYIPADIYFWNMWKAHGRTLYMLPTVSIGHLEIVASRVNLHSGQVEHFFVNDFLNNPERRDKMLNVIVNEKEKANVSNQDSAGNGAG